MQMLLELLRKNPLAKSFMYEEVGGVNMILSCITVAEIQQGARSKENLQQINKMLKQYIVVPIDYSISNIFATLFENYTLSHDCGIPDTLLAANALHYNLPLLTITQKHYKHIPNLILMEHNIIPLKGKSIIK
jgi:predicted nucleic acid-binding protein